ncbi:MAG TPA: tetratricopeptide repeat protein [Roseovarius sp.]|nr:tetratricopeptide repeat protein [Roseovarius sp.]
MRALIKKAKQAPNEAGGGALSNRMWELWSDAPDAHAQDLLDSGMSRREIYDYDSAMKAFDALVEYCPDYAEGYNQRGFIHFLREDFDKALPELEAALERQPRHVAARTGRALTLMALGRNAEAALELRAALDLNPWLGERHLLPVLEAEEDDL